MISWEENVSHIINTYTHTPFSFKLMQVSVFSAPSGEFWLFYKEACLDQVLFLVLRQKKKDFKIIHLSTKATNGRTHSTLLCPPPGHPTKSLSDLFCNLCIFFYHTTTMYRIFSYLATMVNLLNWTKVFGDREQSTFQVSLFNQTLDITNSASTFETQVMWHWLILHISLLLESLWRNKHVNTPQ